MCQFGPELVNHDVIPLYYGIQNVYAYLNSTTMVSVLYRR